MITKEEFDILSKIILKHGKRLSTVRTKPMITSADSILTVMDFNFTLVCVFHGSHNREITVYLPEGKGTIYSSWGNNNIIGNHECPEEMETILRDLLTLND